jgi:hypothetical protein
MPRRRSLSEAAILCFVLQSNRDYCHSCQVCTSLVCHLPPRSDILLVQDVPDPEDPANWKFQVVTSWLGKQDDSLDTAGRLAQVKEKASTMCEPFRSAVLWMPDDTKITYDTMAYWVTAPWDNHDGRATLAGDAAHPMTPREPSNQLKIGVANIRRPWSGLEPCNMRCKPFR